MTNAELNVGKDGKQDSEEEKETEETVVLSEGSESSDESSRSLEESDSSDSEDESLDEDIMPSEVFDLVQTISRSHLPKDESLEEIKLLNKLLNNKNVVVERINPTESIVTDEEEKWSIIRRLVRTSREGETGEGRRGGSFSLTYAKLKSLQCMMVKIPKKSEENRLVFCKECNLFMKRSSFAGHNRFVHKKIRKFLCQTCGYATHTGSILRQHIQAVHVGYTFECGKCYRKFNLKKRLRKHEETCHATRKTMDNADKKYICHFCGLVFSRMSYLKVHLRTHTGECPHQCQYCDRRFKFRWAMVQHERLHTGAKPYKCEFCEESFTQNIVRKSHELRTHGRTGSRAREKAKKVEILVRT